MNFQGERISVVLCTYNGEKFLEEQLASIISQMRPPDELVICDDNSSDGTIDIVKSYLQHAPFPVRLVQNEVNMGSTKNFEQAICLATGDVIALADQDDVWYPNKLTTIETALRHNPTAGYVFSDADVFQDNGFEEGLWRSFGWHALNEDSFSPSDQVIQLLRQNVVTGAAMAFRASLVPLVTPIPASWIHDGWIALIASSCGLHGVALPAKLFKYRRHRNQQVGPGRVGVSRFLHLSGRVGPRQADFLNLQYKQFNTVRQHLLSLHSSNGIIVDEGVRWVDKKIAHLNARILITRSSLLKRLVASWSEYRTGRYRMFSQGSLAILKDLI